MKKIFALSLAALLSSAAHAETLPPQGICGTYLPCGSFRGEMKSGTGLKELVGIENLVISEGAVPNRLHLKGGLTGTDGKKMWAYEFDLAFTENGSFNAYYAGSNRLIASGFCGKSICSYSMPSFHSDDGLEVVSGNFSAEGTALVRTQLNQNVAGETALWISQMSAQ